MMKFFKKVTALLYIGVLLLSLAYPVHADQTPEDLTAQLLAYYTTYQENAQTDISRLVTDLTGLSEPQGEAWGKIMDFWSYANTEMDIPIGVLPDDLPDDDSLCIVVLGYQLSAIGTLRAELVGRLEVALASAEKYPNAYILCTGGATASQNKRKTEAGQMAAWLIRHGISQERIIQEPQAFSTVSNATYSCKLLSESYPQVTSLALVSSDYHVALGSIYLYTQAMVNTYESGTSPLEFVGCAAYDAHRSNSYPVSTQAQGIAQIAGISGYQSLKPQLSQLTSITLDGEYDYDAGSAMFMNVEASYDTGVTRDVTGEAVFTGVDMNTPGEQLLEVSYTENGITATARALIYVAGSPVETTPPQVARTPAPATTSGTPAPLWPFLIVTGLLALLVLLLRLKYAKNRIS